MIFLFKKCINYGFMKIYLAGTPGTEIREREWQKILTKRLLSFWDIQQDQFSVPFAFKLIKKQYESIFSRSSRRRDIRLLP
jgi:hypothetical protein